MKPQLGNIRNSGDPAARNRRPDINDSECLKKVDHELKKVDAS